MKRRLLCLLIAGLIACEAPAQPVAPDRSGALLIAGGGVKSDNADLWTTFLDHARADGPIIIIPSASGAPVQSGASARETLIRHGAIADRIKVARLAVRDDRSTDEVDESLWIQNAHDAGWADNIRNAAAIWFTGGDQSRTTALMIQNGEDTPVLNAVRDALSNGAIIGGTSAGAAIMSDPMIIQGDSLTSLIGNEAGDAVELASGLGFFPGALIDQHFGERARLGRLVAALSLIPDQRVGMGVDEDTALLITENIRVVGRGFVTIVDARNASLSRNEDGALRAGGLTLHLAGAGDRIDPETFIPSPAPWRDATVGDEYFQTVRPSGGGMALPPDTLASVIGEALIDNEESQSVTRISFDGTGQGTRFQFDQTEVSEGYWGRHPETGTAHYTVQNIQFGITPIDVQIIDAD